MTVPKILNELEKASGVEIHGYTNKAGEVSDYTLQFRDIRKEQESDYIKIKNLAVNILVDIAAETGMDYDEVVSLWKSMVQSAHSNLYDDEKTKMANVQRSIYTHWGNGSKVKNEDGTIYIFGFVVEKKVVTPIEYPQKNKRLKTLVKEKIIKACDFRMSKFRIFEYENIPNINII